MKNVLLACLISLGASFSTNAQLPNGSIAPDFTLTDRDGVEHNLYNYLSQGKVVFIKFFACHCPSCWSYHNTGRLEDLYTTYGPDGTDQIMVIMLEYDVNNPEAFTGGGTYTQGDWTAGNSIPMVDVEGTDRTVFDDYNLNYYPMVMKVCTDKTTELMSTGYTTQQLFDEADDCAGNLNVEEEGVEGKLYYNASSKQIILKEINELSSFSVYNLMGQLILNVNKPANSAIDVSLVPEGTYIVRLASSEGIKSQKILIY